MMAALLMLLWSIAARAGTLTVDVLDVGQGDAIVLQSPAGKTVLIDAGTGKRDVVPMLRARGIDAIDLAIASHAHADHIGGMDEVLEAFPVRIYVDQAMAHTTATYAKVMDLVESKNIPYKPGSNGVIFNLDDGIRLEILAPTERRLRGTRSDLNSNSVVARVTKGDHCMLFTGDAEEPTERLLVQKGLQPCDVLKVAHHGSGHSSSQRFLDAVQARHAIISCGKDNKYKHPSPEALERLERTGLRVHRTDTQGTIRVMMHDHELQVVALGPETGTPRPMAAGPLATGEDVHVPLEAKDPASRPRAAFDEPPGVPREPALAASDRLVDLNTATIADLDALPGIGPAKARTIVNWREQHGPFTSIDQLDEVPGIGPATIAGLRTRVSIDTGRGGS